jgi:hypothetical protein
MSLPAHCDPALLVRELLAHQALCAEVLDLLTRESQALHGPAAPRAESADAARRRLLARLDESLAQLRTHRQSWQRLAPEERARHPEVSALIRASQDLIMRAIVIDRENEQGLLRRGLVPPRHLPPPQRQRPHYVADLYRRHAAS